MNSELYSRLRSAGSPNKKVFLLHTRLKGDEQSMQRINNMCPLDSRLRGNAEAIYYRY